MGKSSLKKGMEYGVNATKTPKKEESVTDFKIDSKFAMEALTKAQQSGLLARISQYLSENSSASMDDVVNHFIEEESKKEDPKNKGKKSK